MMLGAHERGPLPGHCTSERENGDAERIDGLGLTRHPVARLPGRDRVEPDVRGRSVTDSRDRNGGARAAVTHGLRFTRVFLVACDVERERLGLGALCRLNREKTLGIRCGATQALQADRFDPRSQECDEQDERQAEQRFAQVFSVEREAGESHVLFGPRKQISAYHADPSPRGATDQDASP